MARSATRREVGGPASYSAEDVSLPMEVWHTVHSETCPLVLEGANHTRQRLPPCSLRGCLAERNGVLLAPRAKNPNIWLADPLAFSSRLAFFMSHRPVTPLLLPHQYPESSSIISEHIIPTVANWEEVIRHTESYSLLVLLVFKTAPSWAKMLSLFRRSFNWYTILKPSSWQCRHVLASKSSYLFEVGIIFYSRLARTMLNLR